MILLKLGGSLITDKTREATARPDVIRRLAGEIVEARRERPEIRMIMGHGSGSFGHHAAARHGTDAGAETPDQWRGFTEVWAAAHRLNRLVMDALKEAGAPALAFPPSSACLCEGGEIVSWALEPLERALGAGLLPVVYGDVAFDRLQGACIVSTETLFSYLAPHFNPSRVLLASLETGVQPDRNAPEQILNELRAEDLPGLDLGGSEAPDVTGGMLDKVRQALGLAGALPSAEVRIFSGVAPGALLAALRGQPLGTRIVG